MVFRYQLDRELCKGCGLCMEVCPKNVLEISQSVNAKGYFPVSRARAEDCILCALCCMMCPDLALSIIETA